MMGRSDTRLRFLPSGTAGVLVELESLDDVLALYAALVAEPPPGVVDVVPAVHTVFLDLDTTVTTPQAVERAVGRTTPRPGDRPEGDLVELPVVYDGADLDVVGELTGWGVDGLVERHTSEEWAVAFCGFAPGFAYLVGGRYEWRIPRRESPRIRVPPGSVALASEFASVYPSASPGGWQLIGSTDVAVFDLERNPPVLLPPGTRVRFVDAAAGR